MDILTSRQFLLLMAKLTSAVMIFGKAWKGGDAFITLRVIDSFVNGFGLRSGHYSWVYETDIYGARK